LFIAGSDTICCRFKCSSIGLCKIKSRVHDTNPWVWIDAVYMADTYLSFIDISYDVLSEAYVDIMVLAFFMWIGLHIGTYGW
jgi:hypothetical protein